MASAEPCIIAEGASINTMPAHKNTPRAAGAAPLSICLRANHAVPKAYSEKNKHTPFNLYASNDGENSHAAWLSHVNVRVQIRRPFHPRLAAAKTAAALMNRIYVNSAIQESCPELIRSGVKNAMTAPKYPTYLAFFLTAAPNAAKAVSASRINVKAGGMNW